MFSAAIWLSFHRIIINQGFLLKRHGLSTDTFFSLAVGLSAFAWSAMVILVNKQGGNASLLSRATSGPLLIQTLFVAWTMNWIDGLKARRTSYSRYYLWNLSTVSGPFDWMNCLSPPTFWALSLSACGIVLATSLMSILHDRNDIQGIFNIIGLIIFFLRGTGNNPYTKARHKYQGDMLRIILPTSHHEGTVYILPSLQHGFDAVWSPKIENEHLSADNQAMQLFPSFRSRTTMSLKEPLECIRWIVSEYQERVVLSGPELENLAKWLYLDPESEVCRMSCVRGSNSHLIGRDLMYALCHAEYLVFMGQGKLSPALQAKVGMLRFMVSRDAFLTSILLESELVLTSPETKRSVASQVFFRGAMYRLRQARIRRLQGSSRVRLHTLRRTGRCICSIISRHQASPIFTCTFEKSGIDRSLCSRALGCKLLAQRIHFHCIVHVYLDMVHGVGQLQWFSSLPPQMQKSKWRFDQSSDGVATGLVLGYYMPVGFVFAGFVCCVRGGVSGLKRGCSR